MHRRNFLGTMLACGIAPNFVRAENTRPQLGQGVAVGDLHDDRAILWTRADRPCRAIIEWDTTNKFTRPTRQVSANLLSNTDFTGKLELSGLPTNQRIVYRVQLEDLRDSKNHSEWLTGHFPSTPSMNSQRDFTIAFTGDVAGQGWGIDTARGGMTIFETMRKQEPDLFVHLGDTIYADGPIEKEVKLSDGTFWRNLVTEEKSKVAETIAEFRGNYRYNLLDEHFRAFNASVSQMVLWDDHEARNNWFPGQNRNDPRYQENNDTLLAARALTAFLEYQPIRVAPNQRPQLYRSSQFGSALEVFAWDMRSERGPNTANRQKVPSAETALLGRTQLDWIKAGLKRCQATWKVIASDMPLGLIVGDGPNRYEAVANGDNGPPLGRELEIAELLQFIADNEIHNVVFMTADVHYCAAHYYDPAKAKFNKFKPFWEFVAGPAHAGTFGPNQLDATFGPEVKFVGIPKGLAANQPPSEGHQFFGTFRIDGESQTLTASLFNAAGKKLYSVDLPPEGK